MVDISAGEPDCGALAVDEQEEDRQAARESTLTLEMEALMAATVTTLLPVLFVFFFAQRYFVQGIVITGVKG